MVKNLAEKEIIMVSRKSTKSNWAYSQRPLASNKSYSLGKPSLNIENLRKIWVIAKLV